MVRKFFVFSAMGLLFVFFFNSCEKKPEVAEAPETEEVTVALTPSDQEMKGDMFTFTLSDLEIIKTINKSTKELETTPSLTGSLKISNTSTNILDFKEVTLEYIDSSGNPVPFKDGKKNAEVSVYWSDLAPGKDLETSFDANVPRAAVEDKSINKLRSHIVYIPTPLKKNVMEVPVKIEEGETP